MKSLLLGILLFNSVFVTYDRGTSNQPGCPMDYKFGGGLQNSYYILECGLEQTNGGYFRNGIAPRNI